MPKISVIIPAYNSERYIRQALKSVLCQTEQDFEVVVINDGSTDGTAFIAKSLARQDKRIRIISQPNSGKPAIARNLGIRHATGEFICFLDADDWFLPRKLEKQLSTFTHYPHLNVVFHDVKHLYENGSQDSSSYLGKVNFPVIAKDYITLAEDGLYLCNPNFYNFMSVYCTSMAIQNVMLRRSCLEAQPVWFPENMTIGEDIDLWFRLALSNRMACLYEVLSCYRRHDNNITNDMNMYFQGSLEVYEKNLQRGDSLFTEQEKEAYKGKISGQHFHYGYYLFRKLDFSSARKEYLKALKLKSSRKTLTAYLKTFLPRVIVKSYQYLPKKT